MKQHENTELVSKDSITYPRFKIVRSDNTIDSALLLHKIHFIDESQLVHIDIGVVRRVVDSKRQIQIVDYRTGLEIGVLGTLNGSMLYESISGTMVALNDETDYQYAVYHYLDTFFKSTNTAVAPSTMIMAMIRKAQELPTLNF